SANLHCNLLQHLCTRLLSPCWHLSAARLVVAVSNRKTSAGSNGGATTRKHYRRTARERPLPLAARLWVAFWLATNLDLEQTATRGKRRGDWNNGGPAKGRWAFRSYRASCSGDGRRTCEARCDWRSDRAITKSGREKQLSLR